MSVSSRLALLFAVPGTSSRTAAVAFDGIGRAAALRFPGVEQRWAYTSRGVRRKLAARGLPCRSPREALAALRDEAYSRVAVVTLHLSDGMEFQELREDVEAFRGGPSAFARLALSAPLMTRAAAFRRAMRALLDGLPDDARVADAVVLAAHGSRDPCGRRTFLAAAPLCREVDGRLLLGTMLGPPEFGDVLRACRAAGARRVALVPLTMAAGSSAREEVAGPSPESWQSRLEREGIACVPVLKGLGEYPGVVEVLLDQAADALGTVRAE